MNLFEKNKLILSKFWNNQKNASDKVASNSIDSERFIVIDTETTGFDYTNDRILCIGAVVLENSTISIQDSLEIYIQQEHYNQASAKIHGILKKDTVHRISEVEALQQFLNFSENAIIIAHHTIFDITMINKALERNGLPLLKNKTLDTSTLYKKTLINSYLLKKKENYSLDELAEKFDISKKDRHTALGDAYITAIAFLKIVKKLKEKKEVTLNHLFK